MQNATDFKYILTREDAVEMINTLEAFKRINIRTYGYLVKLIDEWVEDRYGQYNDYPYMETTIELFDNVIGELLKTISAFDALKRQKDLEEKGRLYEELTKPGGELEQLREMTKHQRRKQKGQAAYKEYVESGKQAEDTQKASEAIENVIMTPFEADPDDDEVYRSHQVNE